MAIRSKKGQNIMEYAVLFAVVIAALIIMQVYIKRKYQGSIKQNVDELGQQYAPGHTTSRIDSNTTSHSESCTGGSCWGKNISAGMTVTLSNTSSAFDKKEAVDSFAADLTSVVTTEPESVTTE